MRFAATIVTALRSFRLGLLSTGTDFDVAPTPENNWVHDNVYSDMAATQRGHWRARVERRGPALDLSGWSNRWQEPAATQATPLLSAGWPSLARRAHGECFNSQKTICDLSYM